MELEKKLGFFSSDLVPQLAAKVSISMEREKENSIYGQ